MKLVDSISLSELSKMAENMYDNLVKAVVDVENEETREVIRKIVMSVVYE